MKLSILFGILLLCFYVEAKRLPIRMTEFNGIGIPTDPFENTARLSCTCVDRTEEIELPHHMVDDISYDGARAVLSFCKDAKSLKVCRYLDICYNCTAETKECRFARLDRGPFRCLYFAVKIKYMDYVAFERGNSRRKGRGFWLDFNTSYVSAIQDVNILKICMLPFTSKTFNIECRMGLNARRCMQKCFFGYTLPEGISRPFHCYFSDNKWVSYRKGSWQPARFEECKPFVDCTLTLVANGYMTCHTSPKSATCSVSCERVSYQEAFTNRTFECSISAEWHPELPFCVQAGSGLELVSRPPHTDHFLDFFPPRDLNWPLRMKETSIRFEDHVSSIAVKEDAAPTAAATM